MTTIAIKDGVMACDSLVSAGDMKTQFKFPKIIKVGDNIYGFAGSCHNIFNCYCSHLYLLSSSNILYLVVSQQSGMFANNHTQRSQASLHTHKLRVSNRGHSILSSLE